MECRVDEFLIQEYLDGSLDRLEKIVMDEHIKVCKKCRRELTEMKLLLYELDSLESIAVPEEAIKIRESVIAVLNHTEPSRRFSLIKMLRAQRSMMKSTGKYLEFVPGTRFLKKSVKKAPQLLYKTMSTLFSGGRRLMMVRARV